MKPEKSSIRHCPICGYEKAEILHTQNFLLTENHPLPKNYDVVCCKKCGFVYADTPASQNVYDYFYTEWSKYEDEKTSTGGGNSVYDAERLYETALTISERFPEKNISILDIGCGNGGLLENLKNFGFTDLTGYDPSLACVKHMSNKNIKAIQGSLFDISSLVNKDFDLVILSHVMEHICDIEKAKASISNRIKDKGYLYIETPDASMYSNNFILPYYYFDTEHINHFDEHFHEMLFSKAFILKEYKKKNITVDCENHYPVVFSILQKNKDKLIYHKNGQYTVVSKSVNEFIEKSITYSEFNIINRLNITQEPIAVFGAGNFTMRLLGNTNLANCNIRFFIDNDIKKHGRQLLGKKIEDISILNHFSGTVLLCVALHLSEIKEQIVKLGYKNNLVEIKYNHV